MRYVYDIEVYPNYMLVGFMTVDGKRVKQYAATNREFNDNEIKKIDRLLNRTLIGFNSKSYDDPILTFMLQGKTTKQVYKKSKELIESNLRYWEVYKKLNIDKEFESIDLIDVAPGQASLKLYGARLNSKKLQDLPYDPHTELDQDQINEVAKYNVNDLITTLDLYNKLTPMLQLREQIGNKYDIDVMSKSDAQIAEAIFRHELTARGVKIQKGQTPKGVDYRAPKAVAFYRDDLNELVDNIEDSTIKLGELGQPLLPEWLKNTTIDIGDNTYNIGLGGLHSQEKQLVVRPASDEKLMNVDVASYYPSLIIELGLYPRQLTDKFLQVYANIKAERLEAKRSGDSVTNNVLKIALNGSYGKFGNKYSFLYSPDLLLTVTFTGQLYLLMLIEEIERSGLKVVSSNTDGVEVLLKKDQELKLRSIVAEWEKLTKMEMEFGEYNALFARDVNNYVAVYPGGKAKAKGAYLDPEDATPILMKNVEYPIVFEAIRDYLSKDIPMEDTLYNCRDVARFTSSRTVKGGAVYYDGELPNTDEYNNYIANKLKKNKALEKRNDEYQKQLVLESDHAEYLGKVVRWYYSINGKPIFYKTGNKVPKTDGAKPMMDLTDYIPKDLDYDKYLQLCNEHLEDLGL